MNKIYIYKIKDQYVAVVATSNYVARQGLDQKYGSEVTKHFQYECSDVVQVQGIFQIDASEDDVKVVEEVQQINQEEQNAQNYV